MSGDPAWGLITRLHGSPNSIVETLISPPGRDIAWQWCVLDLNLQPLAGRNWDPFPCQLSTGASALTAILVCTDPTLIFPPLNRSPNSVKSGWRRRRDKKKKKETKKPHYFLCCVDFLCLKPRNMNRWSFKILMLARSQLSIWGFGSYYRDEDAAFAVTAHSQQVSKKP